MCLKCVWCGPCPTLCSWGAGDHDLLQPSTTRGLAHPPPRTVYRQMWGSCRWPLTLARFVSLVTSSRVCEDTKGRCCSQKKTCSQQAADYIEPLCLSEEELLLRNEKAADLSKSLQLTQRQFGYTALNTRENIFIELSRGKKRLQCLRSLNSVSINPVKSAGFVFSIILDAQKIKIITVYSLYNQPLMLQIF